MEKKLSAKPHIAEAFIPNFAVGCRRLTPGPGYLEALCEDHVDFVSSPIDRITETGIQSADGSHREYDTIVCATGFDTSFRPRIPIIGRNGSNLQDLWDQPAPPHYLSMLAGPDHPNFVRLPRLLLWPMTRSHLATCFACTSVNSLSSTARTRRSVRVPCWSCSSAKSTTP